MDRNHTVIKGICYHAWEEVRKDGFREEWLKENPQPSPPDHESYQKEREVDPKVLDWWDRMKKYQLALVEHDKKWVEAYTEKYGRICIDDWDGECGGLYCEECVKDELYRLKGYLIEIQGYTL